MTTPPARMVVEIELVEIAIDLQAHAGDFVMVFGGRIVGVHTGPPPKMPRDTPPILTQPRPRGRLVKASGRGLSGMSKDSRGLATRMLALVRDQPGINTSELIDALGYSRSAPDRWKPRDVAKALDKSGLLTSELVGGNAKMGKLYSITKKGQAALGDAGSVPGTPWDHPRLFGPDPADTPDTAGEDGAGPGGEPSP